MFRRVQCLLLVATILIELAATGFIPTCSSRPKTSLYASNANELIPMRPGSSVALVTPMEPSTARIDFAGLRKLLQYHVEAGTDNLCILGTTGEASSMSMDERASVLKIAVEEVKGKMPILAGCGTINPNAVKAMTEQAIDIGCDANLLVTPYYVKPPQRALIKHAVTVADYGLPVILYNVPGRTGVNFLDESMAVAAEHENIIGIKDATGDLSRVKNIRSLVKDESFLLYSGDDGTSLDFVLEGGDGCISVTANAAANAIHRVMTLALAGKINEAKEINDKLLLLHNALFCEANPIPVKWAVHRLGLTNSAYCRPPLDEMDPKFAETVETALREAGLL